MTFSPINGWSPRPDYYPYRTTAYSEAGVSNTEIHQWLNTFGLTTAYGKVRSSRP